jgi:hypothetical protein
MNLVTLESLDESVVTIHFADLNSEDLLEGQRL